MSKSANKAEGLASGEPDLFEGADFCKCFGLIAGAGVHYPWWALCGFIDVDEAAQAAVVAARYLGAILYAIEVCAVSMDGAGRGDDARYYRAIASELADAGGKEPGEPVSNLVER